MKKLRFWHQSMTELEVLGNYSQSLHERFAEVMGSDACIEIHGLKSGTYFGRSPTAALANPYVYHRSLEQIVSNARSAEKNGYDAFVIGSFSEPYLTEIRSIVDIPVVSILETSLLVGLSLGRRLVAIANAPEIALLVQNAIERHGLSMRVGDAISLDPAWHEPDLAAAYDDPEKLKDAFVSKAEDCLSRGAEVVIPAEGVLASFLSKQGIVEIKGAPVVDVFAVTWHYALMLARLRERIGLKVTQIGCYARADMALIDLVAPQV